MNEKITIVIADDHGILRDGLSAILNTQIGFAVIGHAANGCEAIERVSDLQPTVAILDIAMPELNGLQAAEKIRQIAPATRVIMLSMHLTEDHVRNALHVGALGYILKDSVGEEVIDAVRTVAAGQRFLSPQIPAMLLENHLLTEHPPDLLTLLSEREQQVLQMLVEGHNNADIATHLGISPKTVHTYRARIMARLDIHDLPGLVRFAIQHGMITM